MPLKRRDQKGFTLIELLIVVAVIGILASIAVPYITQYRIRSYNASAVADLRTLRNSLEAYFLEHGSYPH
ncbi:prepilin-type N-terminal cleavage/methylation domain-containing protein [Geomonas sp. Red69]|uniref:Prepilin-type N-terminal cleavage/methylation domain-containing protein n=1 Tax=Geomonas diazotrophica TaxID=2843197 RepID=A0ABX8JKV9_9BACT|nr:MULTISPECIES: prepilin-type N-terminal cleavage/methylation domain-containing protein [Geomonas]MBU5636474.1 prepilin-type N-terminal cleavage/methylation domain-containing protein [Geomonas diazotrophica]QWV99023.1 prepilin-type N-terminal cleavage/methylation domain-containing protein [Geomonas nitrogeniifigens]QXE88189.1 prepilin-type N-terminal cleavage/methylation domain-containing protein [Geomonas nitrogeniifigens]